MIVTYYKLPYGMPQKFEMKNINKEDGDWFIENDVRVSLEEIGDQVVVYGDIGKKTDDGEPDEIMVLSGAMDCFQTMAKLREECQQEMEQS